MTPSFDERRRILLEQSMDMFDRCWDEQAGMVLMEEDGIRFHSSRDTAFYALGLLLRDQPGDPARAFLCIRRVLECQIIADGEIFDGTFRSMWEQGEPVRGRLDWRHMDPLTRYHLDVYYQRLANAFRDRLKQDEALAPMSGDIEARLQAALRDVYPVVWQTYDPNWREFIVSTFQLIFIVAEKRLPAELAADMERACRRAIDAAVLRAETAFTPLNTNIRVMHVMICDWFGERWHDDALRRHAVDYARELLESYRKHHAVPEFNSPTYNGVVFTFIGFWQTVCTAPELHTLGA